MDGEPLKPNSVDEGEGRSHRRRRWTASPLSRTLSMREKVEIVITEVEGEPLEPNSIDEGEAEVISEAEMMSTGQDLFIRRL